LTESLRDGDPRQVGRYRLEKRLGGGGMGQVFLGRSPGGRPVAVKLVRPELVEDTRFRERFAREVEAARKVGGFYTAQVVDADADADPPWLVTAYVPGPSLHEAVMTHGPLPATAVAVLAAGLAEGLNAIHTAGLVHRDLKPGNVILAADGPRVIDFGIARALDATHHTTSIVGTPAFMSPEQGRGDPVGPQSDVFSLGCVLAYASTGVSPFGTGPAHAIIYRIVHDQPDLSGLAALPSHLTDLITACLNTDPARRPALAAILDHLSGTSKATLEWLPPEITAMITERGAASYATPPSVHDQPSLSVPAALPTFQAGDPAITPSADPPAKTTPGTARVFDTARTPATLWKTLGSAALATALAAVSLLLPAVSNTAVDWYDIPNANPSWGTSADIPIHYDTFYILTSGRICSWIPVLPGGLGFIIAAVLLARLPFGLSRVWRFAGHVAGVAAVAAVLYYLFASLKPQNFTPKPGHDMVFQYRGISYTGIGIWLLTFATILIAASYTWLEITSRHSSDASLAGMNSIASRSSAADVMLAGAVVQAIVLLLNIARLAAKSTLHGYFDFFVAVGVAFGLLNVGLWVWMALATRAAKDWARTTGTVLFTLNTLSITLSVVAEVAPAASRGSRFNASVVAQLAAVARGAFGDSTFSTAAESALIWAVGLAAVILLWNRRPRGSSSPPLIHTGPPNHRPRT
jgi:serine/threonine protein kinase